MGHTANSHSPGSEEKNKNILAVYKEEESFKETKTYKTENAEHFKVTLIGVFVQYETASLLSILWNVNDYILPFVQQLELVKE